MQNMLSNAVSVFMPLKLKGSHSTWVAGICGEDSQWELGLLGRARVSAEDSRNGL